MTINQSYSRIHHYQPIIFSRASLATNRINLYITIYQLNSKSRQYLLVVHYIPPKLSRLTMVRQLRAQVSSELVKYLSRICHSQISYHYELHYESYGIEMTLSNHTPSIEKKTPQRNSIRGWASRTNPRQLAQFCAIQRGQ